MTREIIVSLIIVYWAISTFYIYLLLPKHNDKKLKALLFALFTSPIIGPIKVIADCLAMFTEDSKIVICRHNSGEKK